VLFEKSELSFNTSNVNQNNVQTNPMWKFWGQAQKKIKGQ